MKYKVLISIAILFFISIVIYYFLTKKTDDVIIFDEKLISEIVLDNSNVEFDTVEIINFTDNFAKVKLTDNTKNLVNYAFFREENQTWKLDLIAAEDIGYSCSDLESINYPNQMIVDCKVGLNNSISVSELLNKEIPKLENVIVSGKLFLGEDPNCNCAIITDGRSEIEINFDDNEALDGVNDGEVVTVTIPVQDNLPTDQITVSSDNINPVYNQNNDVQQNNQNDLQDNSLSDYNPNPSQSGNNNYTGGFLDRNYSDLPIQIIGDEGSF